MWAKKEITKKETGRLCFCALILCALLSFLDLLPAHVQNRTRLVNGSVGSPHGRDMSVGCLWAPGNAHHHANPTYTCQASVLGLQFVARISNKPVGMSLIETNF